MKKRVIYLALISAMVISCKQNKLKTDEISSENTLENVISSEIPELPETNTIKNIDDEIQVYTINIGNDPNKSHLIASFPITPYDFVNQTERKFTEGLINEFKSELKKYQTQDNNSNLDFNQHFDVKFHNEDFLVFLYTQNVSYGNNYDNRNIASIFDLKNQKKLTAKDLLKEPENFESFISEIRNLAREAIRNFVKNDTSYANDQERKQVLESVEETLVEGTLPTDKNYDALFFDEEGNWHIIFDKYQIASGYMGEFLVKIPKDIIQKYINERFLHLFENKDTVEQAIINNMSTSNSEVDCSKVPCVALTFDDGPSVYTSQLLDILKEENVKATFFVLGKSASVQKNTIKRMIEEGHNIGNHSYDHKDFRKISDQEAIRQIQLTDQIIEKITGEKPKYFRFPYGARNKANLAMVERPVIMWNIDPLDWKYRDADKVASEMSKASPQGIILAHDIHKSTVEAIPKAIKQLKAKGYHIVTLDDLFRHKKMKNGVEYSNGK